MSDEERRLTENREFISVGPPEDEEEEDEGDEWGDVEDEELRMALFGYFIFMSPCLSNRY